MKIKVVIFNVLFLSFLANTCIYSQDNQLTEQEKKDGWILLFNGYSLDGWTSVGKENPPSFGWEIENGVLTISPQGDKRGGDIITKNKYSNFELQVDFKITKGANSGIKYLFANYGKSGWLGLEYQILDDANHPDAKMGRNGNRLLGGLYDMLPTKNKDVNPIGEWNHARIVVDGTSVTHYLNGKAILKFDRNDTDYKEALLLSKYNKAVPMFGSINEGYILLQDHGDVVSFKNIKIKTLK